MWILGEREPSGKPGGPARQEGEKAGSWLQTVEEKRHRRWPATQETGSPHLQETFMHRVSAFVHCIAVIQYNHNRNRVSLYYLFQENKSFGTYCHLHSSSDVWEVVSSTAAIRTLGVQPTHCNWDYLLAPSRYSGDPDMIPDHGLRQALFACGFRSDLSHYSCSSSVLTAGHRLWRHTTWIP